jgi:Radical SAM superfamily
MNPRQLPNYHLLAKPSGAACNLGCQYCFFLSKENLYGPRESPLMSEDLLETYIRQLMQSSPGPQVDVAWQGSEPMLRGLDFFAAQWNWRKYRPPHRRVQHTIQTNGTLIDNEWAAFLEQQNYLGALAVCGKTRQIGGDNGSLPWSGSARVAMRGRLGCQVFPQTALSCSQSTKKRGLPTGTQPEQLS